MRHPHSGSLAALAVGAAAGAEVGGGAAVGAAVGCAQPARKDMTTKLQTIMLNSLLFISLLLFCVTNVLRD